MYVTADRKDFLRTYHDLPRGSIKDAVDGAIASLKKDLLVGEHIRHAQIPRYYKQRHNVQVLYRIALPQYWRLIYTLQTFAEGEKPTAMLLELMDHDTYNKRFGYFKRRSG